MACVVQRCGSSQTTRAGLLAHDFFTSQDVVIVLCKAVGFVSDRLAEFESQVAAREADGF